MLGHFCEYKCYFRQDCKRLSACEIIYIMVQVTWVSDQVEAVISKRHDHYQSSFTYLLTYTLKTRHRVSVK